MLRMLQVKANKPIKTTYAAGATMTTGMLVSLDHVNSEVDKATDAGYYLVDIEKNYDGINAVVPPEDDTCEAIAQYAKVKVIPTEIGERYATDQITISGVSVGDPLEATAGLFTEATSGDTYRWVYCGTLADPTGTLYIVECVPAATV